MDPLENPFSPGAGSPPPELVGRDSIIAEVTTGLARIKMGRPDQCRLLTGLRGVGKTVLLNKIGWIAREQGFVEIAIEGLEGRPLGALLAPAVSDVLSSLDKIRGARQHLTKSIAVFKSFIAGVKIKTGEVEFGVDVAPEGIAANGDIERDLPLLLLSTAEAAKEKGRAVIVLVDEMQYLGLPELRALIVSLHKAQQMQLPLAVMGAGIPNLRGLAAEAVSYAERLFLYPKVGPLSREETAKALTGPVSKLGVVFDETAIEEIFLRTRGYPYFVQEWGSQAWNLAPTKSVTKDIAALATAAAVRRLDDSFFSARLDRLAPKEKTYLRAMAALGPGAHKTGRIAAEFGAQSRAFGPTRDTLIKKGMIYSPAYGLLEFTVPLFDEFMCRAIPEYAVVGPRIITKERD